MKRAKRKTEKKNRQRKTDKQRKRKKVKRNKRTKEKEKKDLPVEGDFCLKKGGGEKGHVTGTRREGKGVFFNTLQNKMPFPPQKRGRGGRQK